ncbi:MAG: rhodanese-like domain-containing protein [Planctomycetaceae bacterium]|nr:rhodanese-like domain-containing protein [Planctomycetaceae bacterium]
MTTTLNTITAQELKQKLDRGEAIELIDVRTPVEYREVHVQSAKNVPLDQLKPTDVVAGRTHAAEAPLYVICRSGSRGKKACEAFHAAGHANVINVEGGTEACVAAGIPVNRGKKAMSLERQVRIAAGAIVLTGVLLSLYNEHFIWLSGFVGAGLMFAGITDTCAMGMLIAKMPWNQCETGSCSTK